MGYKLEVLQGAGAGVQTKEKRVIFEGLHYFASLQFTQFGNGAINWQLWMMADNVASVLFFVSILAYA